MLIAWGGVEPGGIVPTGPTGTRSPRGDVGASEGMVTPPDPGVGYRAHLEAT